MNSKAKEKLKEKYKKKLWCDLESDTEKYEFLSCGRAHQTGIISPSLAKDVAKVYLRLITS